MDGHNTSAAKRSHGLSSPRCVSPSQTNPPPSLRTHAPRTPNRQASGPSTPSPRAPELPARNRTEPLRSPLARALTNGESDVILRAMSARYSPWQHLVALARKRPNGAMPGGDCPSVRRANSEWLAERQPRRRCTPQIARFAQASWLRRPGSDAGHHSHCKAGSMSQTTEFDATTRSGLVVNRRSKRPGRA